MALGAEVSWVVVDLLLAGGAGAGISWDAADLSWGAGEGAMAIAALIVEELRLGVEGGQAELGWQRRARAGPRLRLQVSRRIDEAGFALGLALSRCFGLWTRNPGRVWTQVLES